MGGTAKRKRPQISAEELARNVRPILDTNESQFLISHFKSHKTTTKRLYLEAQPQPIPLKTPPNPTLPAVEPKEQSENETASKRTQVFGGSMLHCILVVG